MTFISRLIIRMTIQWLRYVSVQHDTQPGERNYGNLRVTGTLITFMHILIFAVTGKHLHEVLDALRDEGFVEKWADAATSWKYESGMEEGDVK